MEGYRATLKVGFGAKGDTIYIFEVEGLPEYLRIPLTRLNAFTKIAIHNKERGDDNGEDGCI